MKYIIFALFVSFFVTFMIQPSLGSPLNGLEFESVVMSDSNEHVFVETIGDGYPTYISLDGYCNSTYQDIDLWVYHEDKLIAKSTDNGCFHELAIETEYGKRAWIKIVVENINKPYDTPYVLWVE